jgi:hypothetical protein
MNPCQNARDGTGDARTGNTRASRAGVLDDPPTAVPLLARRIHRGQVGTSWAALLPGFSLMQLQLAR